MRLIPNLGPLRVLFLFCAVLGYGQTPTTTARVGFLKKVLGDRDAVVRASFTFRTELPPAQVEQLRMVVERIRKETGGQASFDYEREFFFDVTKRGQNFLVVRNTNSTTRFAGILDQSLEARGFVTNIFWNLSAANRQLTFDMDVSRSSQRLFENVEDPILLEARKAVNLKLPMRDADIEWEGERFRYRAAGIYAGKLVSGQVRQEHDFCVITYTINFNDQSSLPRMTGQVTLRYTDDEVAPSSFEATETYFSEKGGSEQTERILVSFKELSLNAIVATDADFSPEDYIKKNLQTLLINVVSNGIVIPRLRGGRWVGPIDPRILADLTSPRSRGSVWIVRMAIAVFVLGSVPLFAYLLKTRKQRNP